MSEEAQDDGGKTNSTLGVVLAGGNSSRMGQDKATLKLASGETFLDRAIANLAQVCRSVAVSGRAVDRADVFSIADVKPQLGPAMAVWSAVQFAHERGFEAVLVVPVDMPLIDVVHLRLLVETQAANSTNAGEEVPACATSATGGEHPLLGVYPVRLEPELRNLAGSKRRSLLGWLQSRTHRTVELPEAAMRDFNTPADLGPSQPDA
jgi:molybdenum cofactor guanylyltransferase